VRSVGVAQGDAGTATWEYLARIAAMVSHEAACEGAPHRRD
jgi:hypothetical protein